MGAMPDLNNKTRIKVRPDTVLENFPLFCPKCKRETIIGITGQNVVVYRIVGSVALSVIGVLIYKATTVYAAGWSMALAIAPASIFIIFAVIGLLYGRIRNKKRNEVIVNYHTTNLLVFMQQA